MNESGAPLPPLAPLAYAAPDHAPPRVALYRVAQFCWAAPLAVGLSALVLYAITQAEAFALVGFFTILGGVALFGIGVVCLIVFWCLLRGCSADEREVWRKRTARMLGLLVLNFPIAFGCAWAGTALFKLHRF